MSLVKVQVVVLAGLLASLSSVVIAHSGATGIVKERMEAMKEMKQAIKTVSDMFKGKIPYDANGVKAAAKVIDSHAGKKITQLFPEGSLHHPSEAKAEIWQEWTRFSHLSERLSVISQGLALAAENTGAVQAADPMMADAMMGSSDMMGVNSAETQVDLTAEEYGAMPAEQVFKALTDNCSACHTRFRVEQDK
ncbi:cytochrome c [Neptuniibacter sp. CAU 1671]|uniref:c-type cytochrome n=1 Tax=Neptuniibacter sp. CAU 1671 TaxID=3032593 RepID=UPI0023DB2787|nr:cytochrome c [Neptuniibacter sp. CAU 1671]MDF2180988.1 cytochrome c [Neptuniibacter sp. CAU 1671]